MNVRKNVRVFATIAKRCSDEHIADEYERCHASIQKKAASGTPPEVTASNGTSTGCKRAANVVRQGQLLNPHEVIHSQSRLITE
jgi:hypothetical protein